MGWVDCSVLLPDDKQKVLIFVCNPNSYDYSNEPDTIFTAHFRKGKLPKNGEIIEFADQHGNNHVPYRWDGPGPIDWFGQDVSHWMTLPPEPGGE